MAVKTLLRVISIVVAFGVGLTAVGAYGVTAQDGRLGSASNVDGTLANITGYGFGPPAANQCVLYSILIADVTATIQVEAGVLRCDGGGLDGGMCPGGHGFVEAYTPSTGYTCNPGTTFANGSANYAVISRNSSPVSRMDGNILGASHHASGLGTSDVIYAQAWAEATGNPSCPGGNPSGRFDAWNKLVSGSGWSIVSNSSEYHGGASICWMVHNVGPAGGFDVD
jgi:hypothetical protein